MARLDHSVLSAPLDHALADAGLGIAVLPLHTAIAVDPKFYPSGCDCRCACNNAGKHPRTRHGLKDATTDEEQIRRWWAMFPQANVGIRTGRVGSDSSGLVVIDVDARHGGYTTLALLELELGPLPERTPRARTGSGGLHVYLAHPKDGSEIRNSAGKLGPGIDVRGKDGYVVAPPSRHVSGGVYEWLPGLSIVQVSPADIPPAWLARLRPQGGDGGGGGRDHGGDDDPGPGRGAPMPLGLAARDFIEHGAAIGEQRMRALGATRNLLSAGYTVEQAVELIWQGLERSPWEPSKPAWTEADAEFIVNNLDQSEPPPLEPSTPNVRLLRAERVLARARNLGHQPRPRTYDITQGRS